MNKKGVSPILAVVLMLIITISLILVMYFLTATSLHVTSYTIEVSPNRLILNGYNVSDIDYPNSSLTITIGEGEEMANSSYRCWQDEDSVAIRDIDERIQLGPAKNHHKYPILIEMKLPLISGGEIQLFNGSNNLSGVIWSDEENEILHYEIQTPENVKIVREFNNLYFTIVINDSMEIVFGADAVMY